MIPKIIHYCWIGGAPLPELAEQCIASWHKYMPEWEYMRWDEDSLTRAMQEPNLDPSLKGRTPKQVHNQSQDTKIWLDFMPTYVKQAYEAKKYAFVSDYVRLWALEQYGGLYMDVDFLVHRPFDDLMDKYPAFAGVEGCKRQAVMMGVIASEPHGAWVKDMLATYEGREFIKPDGSLDLTPNTSYFTDRLESQGFIADGIEKDFFLLSGTKTQINTSGEAINKDKGEVVNQKNGDSVCCEQHSQSASADSVIVSELPLQNHSLPSNSVSTDTESSPYKNEDFQSSEKNTKNIGNESTEERIFMLHVFPVHYFCPQLTTGENVRTKETYCEHKGLASWNTYSNWRTRLAKRLSPQWRTRLIKIKRRIFG